MKRKLSNLLLLLVLSAWSLPSFCDAVGELRPRLVVGIVVDQMRWDYLYRFWDDYTDNGFKRMLREGYSFENCQINYIPSITAIGHTSLFTGSVPSIHGISGNNFWDGKGMTYCCSDTTVQTVGSSSKKAGQMSPCNLWVTTIGDELKTATSWKSKVVGVSFKDRAAILPAGHSADAAYWFDKDAKCFITSTYYMDKLPGWVNAYNERINKKLSIDEIQYQPYGNQIVEEMAKAAIKGERLGQRSDQTDMLTMSFSCPDITGHKYGTHHELTYKQYIGLDKQLADFFEFLDRTVGKGQWLAFLGADHGAANSVEQNKAHKIPAGDFNDGPGIKQLGELLTKKFSTSEKLILASYDYKLKLNREAIQRAGLKECEVKKAIIDFYKADSRVMYVVDLEQAGSASIPPYIREKILNGYNHQRSGDIQLILKPQYYSGWKDIGQGTTHGLWNPYDCHIPFVLMGWGVSHGASHHEVHITDIAPTVCSLIHIQMPSGCIGQGVYEPR
ncbi:MAG: alkaline phosphatase family protein [Prevotella sp.]|nr:alkaline phosphatase family protein [Prevotella sp.]